MPQPTYEALMNGALHDGLSEEEMAERQRIYQAITNKIDNYGHQPVFVELSHDQAKASRGYYDSCTHLKPTLAPLPLFGFTDYRKQAREFQLERQPIESTEEWTNLSLQDRSYSDPLHYAWEMRDVFYRFYGRDGHPRTESHPPLLERIKFTDLGPYRLLLLYNQIREDGCLDIDDLICLQTRLVEGCVPSIAQIIESICYFESYRSIASNLQADNSEGDRELLDFCQNAALACRLDVKSTIRKLLED